MPHAYIALGANLGDRCANLRRAIELIRATPGIQVTNLSTFIENQAVGGPAESPPFINAAAELETTLPARELLECLLEIEHTLGRERREKWGPRSIDLDLLLYADQVIAEPGLQVPHPLMHARRFVLAPLAEIAPQVRHPILRQSITELLTAMSAGRG
jgi:2-amino-4-hydroxy-6-hydroxymethyldihydropteridine diphosphokinase